MVSLPNLAPGHQQLSRQILEPEAEQILPERVSDFDPREVAEALQANPDIAQVNLGWLRLLTMNILQELARQIENDPSLAKVRL